MLCRIDSRRKEYFPVVDPREKHGKGSTRCFSLNSFVEEQRTCEYMFSLWKTLKNVDVYFLVHMKWLVFFVFIT
jgi:hypothetical protein